MSETFTPRIGYDVEGMIEGHWSVVANYSDRREALSEAVELDRRMLYARVRVTEYDYDTNRELQVVRTLFETSRVDREQKRIQAVEEKVRKISAPYRAKRRLAAARRARRMAKVSEVGFALVTAAKMGLIVLFGALAIFLLRTL